MQERTTERPQPGDSGAAGEPSPAPFFGTPDTPPPSGEIERVKRSKRFRVGLAAIGVVLLMLLVVVGGYLVGAWGEQASAE